MALLFLDLFFNVLHLAIIGFNLFGWIPRRTRHLHRWFVAATAFCWLGVGLFIGTIGYCPITDWHWQIKRMRGQTDLPYSYIDFLLRKAGIYAPPTQVDIGVGITFALICLITIVLWWKERQANSEAYRTPPQERTEL